MSKVSSNGNVRVAFVALDDLTDPEAPTATELNTDGLDLSAAIAWEDFTLGATDSDDWDDRALTDLGNAVTRGFANYEASLSFFRDADPDDTNSVYNDAFDTFRTPYVEGYLVMRVAAPATTAFAAGDRVSVFKVISDASQTGIGDSSVKFVVPFLPQGVLYINTLVADATNPLVALPATDSLATGETVAISVTLDGVVVTHSCTFSSADTTKVAVSDLGVVSWVSAGGPTTVSVSHPSVTTGDSVAITTT